MIRILNQALMHMLENMQNIRNMQNVKGMQNIQITQNIRGKASKELAFLRNIS